MATRVTEDVTETWKVYKQDQTNQELRNALIERYLPLVRYNAEKVWAKLPEGVDMNDLISAGVFGLMDAIDAFDLERGVKFETYCVPRIRGAMLDELRTMDWVPRLVRSKASKLEAARKQVEAEVGRPPTDAEIAGKMKLSLEEFEKLESRSQRGEPRQLEQEVVRDRQLQGCPRNRHPRRFQRRRSHPGNPKAGRDAARHQRPQPQRAADHHPLLLRRTDDEGNRQHAGAVRVPRQPNALQHRRPAERSTQTTPARIQLNHARQRGTVTGLNPKHEIRNKSEIPMFQTRNWGSLDLLVFV